MKMNDIAFNFSDKTVIVFGGSRGIGKEVCSQFSKSGAKVYSVSRNIPEQPEDIEHITCDISHPIEVRNIFNKLDKVDFVINVAGTNLCESIDNIDLSEWDRLMDTNLKSFFVICK